jgi:predicted phage-related endonuclease
MVGKVTPDTQASASILPAIMGISKYQSPNDALMGCIHAIQGHERQDISNESMAWGNTFEPAILKEAAMRLGLDNLDLDHDQPYHHAELPLACSLDGTAHGRGLVVANDQERGIYVMGQDSITLDGIGVLEAKLTAADVEDQPPLWRGPVQLQAQMDIIGAKWGAVCTLYRGVALRVYLFAPHEATISRVKSAVVDFENRLTKFKNDGVIDYYPPQDSADASRTWPEAQEDAEPINLGEEEDWLVKQILDAKEKIKLHEEIISECEAKIKAMMRESSVAFTQHYSVEWPMRHYKAQPERIVPAKAASVVRQSTLKIKERK